MKKKHAASILEASDPKRKQESRLLRLSHDVKKPSKRQLSDGKEKPPAQVQHHQRMFNVPQRTPSTRKKVPTANQKKAPLGKRSFTDRSMPLHYYSNNALHPRLQLSPKTCSSNSKQTDHPILSTLDNYKISSYLKHRISNIYHTGTTRSSESDNMSTSKDLDRLPSSLIGKYYYQLDDQRPQTHRSLRSAVKPLYQQQSSLIDPLAIVVTKPILSAVFFAAASPEDLATASCKDTRPIRSSFTEKEERESNGRQKQAPSERLSVVGPTAAKKKSCDSQMKNHIAKISIVRDSLSKDNGFKDKRIKGPLFGAKKPSIISIKNGIDTPLMSRKSTTVDRSPLKSILKHSGQLKSTAKTKQVQLGSNGINVKSMSPKPKTRMLHEFYQIDQDYLDFINGYPPPRPSRFTPH